MATFQNGHKVPDWTRWTPLTRTSGEPTIRNKERTIASLQSTPQARDRYTELYGVSCVMTVLPSNGGFRFGSSSGTGFLDLFYLESYWSGLDVVEK